MEAQAPPKVTVIVNNKEVVFDDRTVTGLQIKQTAISQGVSIQANFALFEKKPSGKLRPVPDDEEVHLHPKQEFRAVHADDNS
ncbi:MAG: multiubiquitin domain-containing protein [Planctomycetaceae bacterium]|nr:multiubiquitin domain-containing protein [Planctomycetaceae bacterium]